MFIKQRSFDDSVYSLLKRKENCYLAKISFESTEINCAINIQIRLVLIYFKGYYFSWKINNFCQKINKDIKKYYKSNRAS